MENISLHILDIVENSIQARATAVEIHVHENEERDLLTMEIQDDGHGMDEEMLRKVLDPFTTTRSTRRVGLGLSLLAESARQSGGDLVIDSKLGEGTTVQVVFQMSSIDMKPLGDMINTLMTLVIGNPQTEFVYIHTRRNRQFSLDTVELKSHLDGVPLHHPDVVKTIRAYLEEGFQELGVTFY